MTTLRNTIRSLFPNCSVGITAGTFDYLHHDYQAFERRSLPCLHVNVTGKEFHLDKNDRKILHTPDIQVVVETLRAAGMCAEYNTNAAGAVSVITEGKPVSLASGLGT